MFHSNELRSCNDVARWLSFLLMIVAVGGCTVLSPQAMKVDQLLLSEELKDGNPQIQRGTPRKVIDTVGWVVGIPGKILLWNRRIDNHRISDRTATLVEQYLIDNRLETTRVRLNQYAPRDDWRRLVRNKRVGAPWRYTFGAIATLGETVFPGRIFGGDHYNAYTDTIHLYSDVPAIGLHEGGHAKDFARRKWKGTYAAVYALPIIPLYHERIATRDALAYADYAATPIEQREAINVLYPAYGTYFGSAFGTLIPSASTPIYYGSVLAGHVAGRFESNAISIENGMSDPSQE
jgi:energy-converting hydrogenase Eha subunit F